MQPTQRQRYLTAVTCFNRLKTRFRRTRLSDFVGAYKNAIGVEHRARELHSTFLPTRRAIMRIFDHELTTQCRYTGPIPYWDWTLDAISPEGSPLWAVHTTATFKIISKDLIEQLAEAMEENDNNYDRFRMMLEFLHQNLMMYMSFKAISPSDVLFWLHIRNMDRLWAIWQARENTRNAFAYGGVVERGKIPTVDDSFLLYGLYSRSVVVSEVMNTKSGKLDGLMCYEYIPPQTVRSG